MKLGFVSAIVPELELKDVFGLARQSGYDCVEVMCWPAGKAERRYAGVTHIDVNRLDDRAVAEIHEITASSGVGISGLGYYPNPLAAGTDESAIAVAHLKKIIAAAKTLGVPVVNTFIGRDWTKSVDENWPRFLEVWRDLIASAEDHGIRIGIENCAMLFSRDEWPGGKNLAHSPAIWRRMFDDIPSANFGLNYDPSHMVWQMMDYIAPIREFRERLFHVHLKDARVDRHRLNEVGILAYPLEYHTPKLPGLGEVDWGHFFSALGDVRYRGPVCVEVEDRAYEGSLDDRKRAIVQCHDYLRQFLSR